MKVKQLIKELQKMPQNADVGYSHGDNAEHEVAGWCCYVVLLEKENYEGTPMSDADRECLNCLPAKVVVIRG